MKRYNSPRADAAIFSINEVEQAFNAAREATKGIGKVCYGSVKDTVEGAMMMFEQVMRASLGLEVTSEGRGGRSPITNMGGNMAREELKEFRKNKGLTQAEMAEKLDLSLSHYKSIELGTHDPSIKLLTRFYEIFGNECDDVLRLFINK